MKRIIWIRQSRFDLKEFPDRVHRAVGHALLGVQKGEVPPSAKLLRGFDSAKIWEIRENDSSGTYRAVYTVEFKEIVVVLHVFQKKSKCGIATPRHEIEIIKQRLKEARALLK